MGVGGREKEIDGINLKLESKMRSLLVWDIFEERSSGNIKMRH